MMRPFLAFSSLLVVTAVVACGSSNGGSSTTSTGGSASTSTSGAGGSSTHMNQCVLTTDTGNNNGVGAYCTPGGGQCSTHPLAGLCLADVGQDEWFCTRIGCTKDSDCGDNATCVMQSGGSGCVPNKCLDNGDGGTPPGDAGGG
jgi:hypothetical protein